MISLAVHAVVLGALAFIASRVEQTRTRFELTLTPGSSDEHVAPAAPTLKPLIAPAAPVDVDRPIPLPPPALPDTHVVDSPPVPSPEPGRDRAPAGAPQPLATGERGDPASPSRGGGLAGRDARRRGLLADENGGSPASEQAVERGLKWLLAHQRPDGSWRFKFDQCDNACRNPGTEASSTAATALALLPFYGAGYTHKQGPYTEQVNRGLYYLGSRMLLTPQGGDLQEGTMYAQGLATIVLCEAYAMSRDSNLRPFAQSAVDFIVYAQDKKGGGWRYFAGQKGDSTVTGWQLMALKSAQMADLDVPSQCFYLAEKFFDSVQSDRGAAYGYLKPGNEATTSAVGLLCRMYLGWRREHPALIRGAASLDKLGPSANDMYFNYYATQVLYHHGGPAWDRWNRQMRDHLVAAQSSDGHESGSWFFDEEHGNAGGRLYNTAMAILTLEVYYRYLPLFSPDVVEE